MTKHVFISHSSQDKEIALLLLRELESAGEKVWMAPRDVPSGMSYPAAIIGAIRDCHQAVLVLSEYSNSSPHVLREVERISSERLPLHVIRIDPVELSDGLAYFAAMLQWTEASREMLAKEPGKYIRQILERGGQSLPRPAPTPDPPSHREAGMSVAVPASLPEAISFAELAEQRRGMLSAFGLAILDYIGRQPNPSTPIPPRELLRQLRSAAPKVFGDINFRRFSELLKDARDGGCAPGLMDTPEGVFMMEENIAIKRARNRDAKARIAAHATSLIQPGMLLALDGGSTTQPIAECICDLFEQGELNDIGVITNSLAIADTFSRLMVSQGWTDDNAQLQLYLAGGRVRANTHATAWGDDSASRTGVLAELAAYGRSIDLGFIGCNGFEYDSGLTMGSDAELGLKRFVVEQAGTTYFVADSSKAGITLPVKIAGWEESFTVLTDDLPQPAIANLEELILAGRIIQVTG